MGHARGYRAHVLLLASNEPGANSAGPTRNERVSIAAPRQFARTSGFFCATRATHRRQRASGDLIRRNLRRARGVCEVFVRRDRDLP